MPPIPAIHLDAVVKSRMETQEEFDAYVAVFEQLIEFAEKDADPRLHIRVWCRNDAEAEQEFYEEYGFRHTDTMFRMVRPLHDGGLAMADTASNIKAGSTPAPLITVVDLADSATMEDYIAATKEAFGFPDSPEEMLYRLNYGNARVFTVENKTYATTWPLKNGGAATENVFTRKLYQRQGYAEKLLNSIAEMLKNEGCKTAELNVYQNDKEAIKLYEKLGYEKQYELLEMMKKI